MKEVMMSVNGFECEVCGYRSQDSFRVETCEKRHSCEHKVLDVSVASGMITELTKRCDHCYKEFETIVISEKDSSMAYAAKRKGREEILEVYDKLRLEVEEEDIFVKD